MIALIHDSFPKQEPFPVQTFTVQELNKTPVITNSTLWLNYDAYLPSLNERALRLLEEFKDLKENWDEQGAKAPSPRSVRLAEVLVKQLQQTGQKVFHVAPGPDGEVMVDVRENRKSIEILFYADKMRYVLFPAEGRPTQGAYHYDELPKILKWLHE